MKQLNNIQRTAFNYFLFQNQFVSTILFPDDLPRSHICISYLTCFLDNSIEPHSMNFFLFRKSLESV